MILLSKLIVRLRKPIYELIPGHLIVAGSAWISRVVAVFVQLLSIRILLGGIGTEQYAVFVLLNSLMGWYMFTDMGVGASLQNYISEQRAQNKSSSDYVVTAAMISIVQLLLIIAFLYFISPYIAPIFLKEFKFLTENEKIINFYVVGILFLCTAICSITYKIWYAEQKGYLSNIVPAISSLISLAIVWGVLKLRLPNELFLSLVAFGAPAMITALFLFFRKTIISIRKDKGHFDWRVFKQIMKRAIRFSIFTLMGLIITQLDYIILSQTVRPDQIVTYNIGTKLFSFVFSLYSAVLAAFLPVSAEMYIRNEFTNIKRLALKYNLVGVGFICVYSVFLLLFSSNIANILSPKENIILPGFFIILIGFYFIIRIWNDTFVILLLSMNKFREMFIISPFHVLLSGSLQFFLSRRYGIVGIVLGLSISYLLTGVWALPLVVRRYISGKNYV